MENRKFEFTSFRVDDEMVECALIALLYNQFSEG
jgi:hypothetical protein